MTAESAGFAAFGTTIAIGDAATPEVFTTIAQVKSISGIKLSADTKETTNHGSPSGFEEVVVTVLRTGELTFDVNFDPAGTSQAKLVTAFLAKAKHNFELTFPTSTPTVWTFAAYVTGIEPGAEHDGVIEGTFTLKPTGVPDIN